MLSDQKSTLKKLHTVVFTVDNVRHLHSKSLMHSIGGLEKLAHSLLQLSRKHCLFQE